MYNIVWYQLNSSNQKMGQQVKSFYESQYDQAYDFVIEKSKELSLQNGEYRLFWELVGIEGIGYINPEGCKFDFTGKSWV